MDLSYPGNPEVTDPYLTIRNTFKAVFGEDMVCYLWSVKLHKSVSAVECWKVFS